MIAITGISGSGKTLYSTLFARCGLRIQDETGLVFGADVFVTQRADEARRMKVDQIHSCLSRYMGLWKFRKQYIFVGVHVRDWETGEYVCIKRRVFTVKQLLDLRGDLHESEQGGSSAAL